MSKRKLSYDPVHGITTWYEGDGASFKIGYTQDVSRNIEQNKRLQNTPEYKRHGIKNDWYHFAHVPAIVLMQFKDKHNLDWQKKEDLPKIEKLLMSREYCHLRTVDRI